MAMAFSLQINDSSDLDFLTITTRSTIKVIAMLVITKIGRQLRHPFFFWEYTFMVYSQFSLGGHTSFSY
jgi:hypothetical protein